MGVAFVLGKYVLYVPVRGHIKGFVVGRAAFNFIVMHECLPET